MYTPEIQTPGRIVVGGNQSPDLLDPRVRGPYNKLYSLVAVPTRPHSDFRVGPVNFHYEGQGPARSQTITFFGLYLPAEMDPVVDELNQGWGEGNPLDRQRAWFQLDGDYVPGHVLGISSHPIIAVLAAPDHGFRTRTIVPEPPESHDHSLPGARTNDNAFAFLKALTDRLYSKRVGADPRQLMELIRAISPDQRPRAYTMLSSLLDPPPLSTGIV